MAQIFDMNEVTEQSCKLTKHTLYYVKYDFRIFSRFKVEVEQEGYLLSGLQFMFCNGLTFLIFKLHASQLFSRRGKKLKF
jgi:hypothetical protein